MHSANDADPTASNLSPYHGSSNRGVSTNKRNLITEAMAAAMTPTTTTMMMPSTSVVSTPQPTGGNDRCQYKQYNPGFYLLYYFRQLI